MTDDEYKNAEILLLRSGESVIEHLKAMQARIYALEKKVITLENKKTAIPVYLE